MEIRNRMIRIRVTDEEYEAIKKNAPNGNMSEWLRTFAFLCKPKKRKAKEVNPELLYELNKIGVNLNQIAKAINSDPDISKQLDLHLILISIDSSLKDLREIYS